MGIGRNAPEPPARRKRILFVAEAVTLAHVVRPFVLAQSLDPSRYEVHFAADPRYNKLLGPMPFPHHPIHTIPSDKFLSNLAWGRVGYNTRTLLRYIEDDKKLIAAVKPDVVVSDLRWSMSVSTRVTGVPYVMITNAYWSPYARRRFPVPCLPLTRLLTPALLSVWFRINRPLAFFVQCRPHNRIRRRYGLPTLGSQPARVFTDGDTVLYADVPEQMPTHNRPASHRYIGPVLWSPAVKPPPWWDSLPADRPIVYATLGSSGGRDQLRLVLDALADLPVTVIAATAGRTNLKAVPANAYVADYLPGEEAAARANVVICNGGSPTTQQALVSGVPVIGVVNNIDQHLNMEAVERAGAGILLRSDRVKAKHVAAAVRDALSRPDLRHGAQWLADAYHRDLDRFPQQMDDALRAVLGDGETTDRAAEPHPFVASRAG